MMNFRQRVAVALLAVALAPCVNAAADDEKDCRDSDRHTAIEGREPAPPRPTFIDHETPLADDPYYRLPVLEHRVPYRRKAEEEASDECRP